LQGLFIRDGVAVLAGARIGTDGQEPGLHRARLGRRELDKQGLREDRPAGLGAYPRDGLPRLNKPHTLSRVDGAHAPDRRAALPRALEMQREGRREIQQANGPALPGLDLVLLKYRDLLVAHWVH